MFGGAYVEGLSLASGQCNQSSTFVIPRLFGPIFLPIAWTEDEAFQILSFDILKSVSTTYFPFLAEYFV